MFNIAYVYAGVVKHYCAKPCDHQTAERTLRDFKRRYLNADGTGRAYPNGKGVYPISNPRIVAVG